MTIGAGRARLIRQFLTESVLLSSLGTVGRLVRAVGEPDAVCSLSSSNSTVVLDLSIDGRVLAFTTAVVAVVTGILFGLAPAWRYTVGSDADRRQTYWNHCRSAPSYVVYGALSLFYIPLPLSVVHVSSEF